jgi:hypothetical protein
VRRGRLSANCSAWLVFFGGKGAMEDALSPLAAIKLGPGGAPTSWMLWAAKQPEVDCLEGPFALRYRRLRPTAR